MGIHPRDKLSQELYFRMIASSIDLTTFADQAAKRHEPGSANAHKNARSSSITFMEVLNIRIASFVALYAPFL